MNDMYASTISMVDINDNYIEPPFPPFMNDFDKGNYKWKLITSTAIISTIPNRINVIHSWEKVLK